MSEIENRNAGKFNNSLFSVNFEKFYVAEMADSEPDYEDMEVLDYSPDEDDTSGGNQPFPLVGFEIDPLQGTSQGTAVLFDFVIEAYERVFKGQKKEKPLEMLHVQATSKGDFEQQVWQAYNAVLRREILYQRAEEGMEEMLTWSPTKPAWADRDRFFILHFKRNTARLSDLTDELLAAFNGTRVKMAVLVYSLSLRSSKDYDRAKVVLGLGNRRTGLTDRAGADSNQSMVQLVSELKERNKNHFVRPMDASFTLWANYIQGSAAHLRDDLLAGPPPELLKNLFTPVDEVNAQAVLEESFDGASVAEAVNESIETELKEIDDAFKKVESSVSELRQKIDQLHISVKGRKSLISAFKNSLKTTQTEESKLIAEGIVDCPDIDHE